MKFIKSYKNFLYFKFYEPFLMIVVGLLIKCYFDNNFF